MKMEDVHYMKNKILFIAAIAILGLSYAWSADVSGKWTAQAQGADITLTLKADGAALTGTLNNSQSGQVDIKDGKIEGDDISFYVVRKIGESEMKITWKGKVAGDEIKFKREVQGGMGGPGGGAAEEIVAKRAK
jgi:hypothetical protein